MNGPKTLRIRDGVEGSPRNALVLLKNVMRNRTMPSQALIATLRMRALMERAREELIRSEDKKKTDSLKKLFVEALDGITGSEELLKKLKKEAVENSGVIAGLINVALNDCNLGEMLKAVKELEKLKNWKAVYYVSLMTKIPVVENSALVALVNEPEMYHMEELQLAYATYRKAETSRYPTEIEGALQKLVEFALLPHKNSIKEEVKNGRKAATA